MAENEIVSNNESKLQKNNSQNVYKKLIARNEGLEYYLVFENGKSHMEVNLIQPSWEEQGPLPRLPKCNF